MKFDEDGLVAYIVEGCEAGETVIVNDDVICHLTGGNKAGLREWLEEFGEALRERHGITFNRDAFGRCVNFFRPEDLQ